MGYLIFPFLLVQSQSASSNQRSAGHNCRYVAVPTSLHSRSAYCGLQSGRVRKSKSQKSSSLGLSRSSARAASWIMDGAGFLTHTFVFLNILVPNGRGPNVFLGRLWATNFGNLHDGPGKIRTANNGIHARASLCCLYLCSDLPSSDNSFANEVLIKIRVLFMSQIK